MPDLAGLGNGQGISVGSGDPALELITVAWQLPEQGYCIICCVFWCLLTPETQKGELNPFGYFSLKKGELRGILLSPP